MTSQTSASESLSLPMTPNLPGSELTMEPFRFDQRLFASVLQIPSSMTASPVPAVKAENILRYSSKIKEKNFLKNTKLINKF